MSPLPLTADALQAMLADAGGLDAEDGSVTLLFGAVSEREGGDLFVTVRKVLWDTRAAERQVEMIYEQDVVIVPATARDDAERVRRFVGALGRALPPVLGREAALVAMPHELVLADVLALARAETEADFERALVTKGRLGRFL